MKIIINPIRLGVKFILTKSNLLNQDNNGIITNQRVKNKKIKLSRELRKNMTKAEKIFWDAVRNRKLFGLKFRRQQIIGGLVVDFYCDSLRLCVEIDGDVHTQDEQKEYDEEKNKILKSHDLNLLRVTNNEVLNDFKEVIQKIKEFMGPHPDSLSP